MKETEELLTRVEPSELSARLPKDAGGANPPYRGGGLLYLGDHYLTWKHKTSSYSRDSRPAFLFTTSSP